MSLHIQKFVDRLRGFEARGAKEFMMSINDAKDLHADITRLFVALEVLRAVPAEPEDKVVQLNIDGGSF